MSLKINYNISAMIANNSLKMNDNKLSAALERLSSGYKINNAKDDAAGLAIARRMNAQIKGLSVAEQDAKDGVSVVEIADGALAEVHDMLQRMNELAIKASNGTVSDDDRETIQSEVNQLKDEITRIGETTEYNGRKLFDGTFDLKGYTDNKEIKVNYFSDAVDFGKYELNFTDIDFDADGTIKNTTKASLKRTDVTGAVAMELSVSGDSEQLILTGEKDFEIRIGISEDWNKDASNIAQTSVTVNLDLTKMGPMTLQIGANEGQTIDIRIPELSLLNAGIKKTDVSTAYNAEKAIGEISNAISYVSEMRSRMGAYQNRLEHTETSLATSQENVTSAYSRIMDTDMATEMTEYSNMQVVSQAATAMLAQANERPSQMLQLLQ
ncbi:MAG: flagellin FliC3 [Lachnospiraceae bacterium]|nr:flagellin FliC3 [Lachnospiraceae bacterium]